MTVDSPEHRNRVAAYVTSDVDKGADLVVDVAASQVFLGPRLLYRLTPETGIYREKVLGPALSVLRTTFG